MRSKLSSIVQLVLRLAKLSEALRWVGATASASRSARALRLRGSARVPCEDRDVCGEHLSGSLVASVDRAQPHVGQWCSRGARARRGGGGGGGPAHRTLGTSTGYTTPSRRSIICMTSLPSRICLPRVSTSR